MQTKPQIDAAKMLSRIEQANKTDAPKLPQPLDTKLLNQVGGGRLHPGGTW